MPAKDALIVKRTHLGDPDDLDGCRYEVTMPTGVVYEVAKEFYAAGPSLFTWALTGGGLALQFATKKAALAHLRSLPAAR